MEREKKWREGEDEGGGGLEARWVRGGEIEKESKRSAAEVD